MLAAAAIPRLLLVLAGGVWADRLPRQRVMLAADAVNLFAQTAIGVELLSGSIRIGHLAALSALSGAASAFFMPAADGLIPATVDAAHLQQANALTQASRQASRVLGPLLATTLVVTAGAGWAFLFDAATFAVSVGTLALLRVEYEPAPREGFWAELAGGWAELRRHRWYWTNLIAHAVWNLISACFNTLGPLVAVTALGGQFAWGVITQGAAIGAVAGSVLAMRVHPRRPLVACNLALTIVGAPLVLLAAHAPAALISVTAGLAFGGLDLHEHHLADRRPAAHPRAGAVAGDGLRLAHLARADPGRPRPGAGPLGAAAGVPGTLVGAAVLVVAACLLVLAVPEVRRLGAAPAALETV